MLAPAYRGSTGFGEDLPRLRPGDDTVPAIAAGASYLKSMEPVDAEHVGVVGFSFGGYLTLLSLARQPDLFAAAVAFYGGRDLLTEYHDNPSVRPLLKELMGGTPDEKPEVYRAQSPALMANRIKTPLLILCGTADQPAYSQMQEMATALKQAHKEKEYDFISHPGAGHGFVGKDEIDSMQQCARFLSILRNRTDEL